MKIRPYRKGDEENIMALDARELPSRWNPRTLKNWYWKFTESNPAGHALIWLAEHKGSLVGHFAAVPYRLKVFDEEIRASHTIGALVDKKYQNRGLLKFVGDNLMEELEQNDIPVTWGFPNKRAHKFENSALGYRDLINFDQWRIKGDLIGEIFPDPDIRGVTDFDERFDRLWENCSQDYKIAVVRKRDYLNWRYQQRPDWDYHSFALIVESVLRGYVVIKLYREDETLRGHIIDIFAARNDRSTLSRLIEAALSFFIAEAVDEVTVWFWGNPMVEELLAQKGFVREKIIRPLILRINKSHKYQEKIVDSSHWYFTMGDSTEIF